jgi:hypothetical protein
MNLLKIISYTKMKKILFSILLLLILGAFYLDSLPVKNVSPFPSNNSIEKMEEKYKADWMEGLMEFVDEDIPMDSIYIPDFLL